MKSLHIFKNRSPKHPKHSSLQHRFIVSVLIPPFIILLIIGLLVLWFLNGFVRNQAIDELNRAASTTAAKLEREFAIRETVLKRTGEELFVIKSQYQSDLTKLEQNREACKSQIKQNKDFRAAPGDACKSFYSEIALRGTNQSAIEEGYIQAGQSLAATQKSQINERLTSFGQFFPETAVLMVTDKDGKVISSALNEELRASANYFSDKTKEASSKQVEGTVVTEQGKKLALFSYPISSGGVLAAYDLTNKNFLNETWKSTPIDQRVALAVILGSDGSMAYPTSADAKIFASSNQKLRKKSFDTLPINNKSHISTGSEAKGSNWLVVVASPKNVVLSPVRDAQIAAVLIIGSMLVGFLWVGAYFIHKTTQSILRLVAGAIIFSGGNLDYRISLDKADEEFVALADTMNNMAARIASAEKELDEKNKEFISIATHELRTPLTAIKGNLSIAYEDYGDQLNETIKPVIEQAFAGTTRLATLVNDMLDMARLDGNRVEFKLQPLDAKALAQEVVDSLNVTANEKSISLTYDPAQASSVIADESKFRIVLNNFISNAIKYNRQKGTVNVSHTQKDGLLVTSVTDTGLGIPEDQKAHMFEKFFRVDNEDRKNIIGTGLGMYITREYVVKMGGKVWFESVHGQGSSFHFSLPIADDTQSITPVIPTMNIAPK